VILTPIQPSICFLYQINSLVRLIKPIESQIEHEASLIVVMMNMSSIRSERSSEPIGQRKHGRRILPAALAEPPTPTVGTLRGTAGASRRTNATAIGTTVKGMVKLTNGKV
jgi:sensor histidine kinase regulating citrate/malate metabolism